MCFSIHIEENIREKISEKDVAEKLREFDIGIGKREDMVLLISIDKYLYPLIVYLNFNSRAVWVSSSKDYSAKEVVL